VVAVAALCQEDSCTHLCYILSQLQGHGAIGMVKSIKEIK
jgi:hypothetical protein